MIRKTAAYLIAVALAVLLNACAAPGPQPGEIQIRTGVIEQITSVHLPSNHHAGVGAVVGGITGLGIGSLIGAGTGRDVAMVLGTLGGAFAGNEIQKKHDQPIPGQEIIVRLSNGVLISVTQPVTESLHKGQRVYVEGNGDGARVVAR